MPRSPDRFSTGSPGIRWISANAIRVTPMNVGTISATRRSRNANIAVCHPERPPVIPRTRSRAEGPCFYSRSRQPINSRSLASLGVTKRSRRRRLRQIDLVEVVMRRRIHLVTLHVLAQRIEADRVRNGDPRRLFLEDDLRLLIELRAIGLLRRLRRLDDQVLERLVAPARVVAAALHRFATE